jgi:flagellar FliL protein
MAEENLNEAPLDETEAGPYTEEEGKKISGGLLKILMIVASILVGVILMVIISNIVFNIKSTGVSKQEEVLWAPGVTPKKPPYQTLHIDPLKLNLNDPTGTNPVFIQIELALAYEQNNIKLQTELLSRRFEIRDKIITLISSKTYEDINTPDKSQSLKKEIKNQVNTLLINGLIEDVYIIDFNAVPRT